MRDDALLGGFSSTDPDLVLDALFVMGGERHVVPGAEVFEAALTHLSDEDSDVRRQVVFAVGIHWAYSPAFENFVARLAFEEDDDVIDTLLAAVARIARESPSRTQAALAALHSAFSRKGASRRVRLQAYLEARRLCGRITAAEYAAAGIRPVNVEVDEKWWDEVLSVPGAEPT